MTDPNSLDIPQLETPDPPPLARVGTPPYATHVAGKLFYLRQLTESDVGPRYLGWMHDAEVLRYIQARFAKRDSDSLRTFVRGFDHINNFIFAICDADSDLHVGNITLRADPNHLFAHMGYLIGDRNFWHRNVAVEATRLILDFAFFQRGLRKVLEPTTANHLASNFNFKRLGFTFEGKIPDLYWGEGRYQAATFWSMKATRWAELRGHPADKVTP